MNGFSWTFQEMLLEMLLEIQSAVNQREQKLLTGKQLVSSFFPNLHFK